ncbi:MAG: NAD(P)H-hydrate dehydratase [Gemmatimonadetes bacterium]|nr:NAD(P)H-hydrate dehydratase [Gemmatimonadota bacterium]NNM04832.1 NAD(P)H-hydrate dehydratase [Gemmatimonadota bacterium]
MITSSDLQIRPFGRALVGAPSGAESAEFDRFAIDDLGVPQPTLMENAGRSAAQVLQALYPGGQVTALVGTGNNGGDGLVLLRNLAAWGRRVTAIIVGDRGENDELLHGWGIRTLRDSDFAGDVTRFDGELATADVIVDGVLGTGITGPPRERQAFAITGMNRAEAPVFALDIPSGVDGESGALTGDAVVAEVTVAFGGAKLGTLLHPGRRLVGRLVVVEIGFPPVQEETFPGSLITPGWVSRRLPRRDPDTHKNAVGALLLVAGRSGMAGAAILAARAALRTGVGFLRVASPPENRSILQEAVPEAVYVDSSDGGAMREAVEASRALGVGPGLGTDDGARRILVELFESGSGKPLLLDADALNLVAAGGGPSLADFGETMEVVLTPHPGEMARLTGKSAKEITAQRPRVAAALAVETGCSVLLKGLPSLVTTPASRFYVDTVGNSDLAAAGMGDVLSGVISAFLAQGSPPHEAACLGLHTSGRAAARTGLGVSLTPEDVVDAMPGALRENGDGDSDLDFPFLLFDQDPAR